MTHIFDINVTEMGLLSNIITSHYYNTLYRITWHSFVKMSTNHAQSWVTPTKNMSFFSGGLVVIFHL